jgi:hypothetical protein
MTHDELLARVTGMCDDLGYPWHYCRDSRHCDGKGFPDLCIVGRHRVIFAELKPSTFDTRSPEQVTWGHALLAAGQLYVVWYVSDLEQGHIARALDGLRNRLDYSFGRGSRERA